jgi:hypothetical protein
MSESVAETKTLEPAEIEALLTKARTEAAEAGKAEHGEIIDLCAIAGDRAQALTFIKDGKTVAEVRTSLLAAKVAEQEKTAIDTAAKMGTQGQDVVNAPEGKAKPWGDILVSLGLKKKEGK